MQEALGFGWDPAGGWGHFPPSRGLLPSLWVLLYQILGAVFLLSWPLFLPAYYLGVTGIPKVFPSFYHLS